jgi:nitroreductase / dihydropteridine reductase
MLRWWPMQNILDALNWRYAVQTFDPAKKVSDADLQTILESGRLAPSSFGLEPWQFIVVENSELRTKLRAACFDQEKVTDASHFVVIARRTDARAAMVNELIERTATAQQVDPAKLDGLRNMVDGYIARQNDAELDAYIQSQCFIPLGIMIEAAALLGVDSGPMGGFIPAQADEVLGLTEKNLTATVMLALGYRGDDSAAKRPKVRRAFSDVVTVI